MVSCAPVGNRRLLFTGVPAGCQPPQVANLPVPWLA